MNCEVCGNPVERPVEADIEGVNMKVCSRCSRFGSITRGAPPKAQGVKPRRPFKGTAPAAKEKVLECVDDYNTIIRTTREKKGMTREDLGRVLNEKASVIARLESGTMVPDIKLARKIESALRIKILGAYEDEKVEKSGPSSGGFTIGDFIK
ncbi:MAG: multiprotein bridging factor aMBF1 [Candidatus Hydrothermarchaeaceae archaeon]